MSFSFIVEFVGEPLIDLPLKCVGLSHVKELNNLVKQDIPLNAIGKYINAMKEILIDVELDADRAIICGHFMQSGNIQVKVSEPKSFNKYVYENPVVTIDRKGIRYASFERKIDSERILDDWASAEYPKVWKIDSE